MTLLLATQLLQVLAAVLSVLLARSRPDHRPLAVLLVYGALANSARVALQQLVVLPAVIALGGDPAQGIAPAAPLAGWARAAAHADHALLLGWSASVAGAGLAVFSGLRSRWTMAGPALVWAALVTYFVITYPDSRPLHRQGYLVADLLAISSGLAAFVGWLRRRAPKEEIGVPRRCILYILFLDGLALFGPHLTRGFYTDWNKAQSVYCVLYIALIAVQGVALWHPKKS